MNSDSKKSIKLIEVLLIVLIAIAALAIWTEADRQLGISLKDHEPNEIVVQQTYGVQSKQVDLAAQQKWLDSVESRLSDRQAEQIAQANDVQSLATLYPQLVALPITGAQVAPLSTMQAYVQSRREMSETTFLVNQLEADFTTAVADTVTLSATLNSTNDSAQRQAVEAQLLAAQALRDSLQKALVEARLKLPALSAKIASLDVAYPQLAQLTPEQQIALSLPSDVVQAYIDAQRKQRGLDAEINTLTDQAKVKQSNVVSQTIALAQAQRDTAQDLAKKQEEYIATKRGKIIENSLIPWSIVMGAAIVFLFILSFKEVSPNWIVVIGGAVALVLVLLAYQALQNLGSLIALGFVLFIVFFLLPWKKKTTTK